MEKETQSFRQSFAVLNWYVRPEWRRILLLFILLFAAIGLQLLQPRILADFIDLATGETDATTIGGFTNLTTVAIFFIGVALAYQAFSAAATYVTQDVRWRTTNELRADLAQHTMNLDMGFHNARTAGEMISRVDEDVNTLSNFFAQFIIQVLGNGLLIAGVVVVLARQDARIGAGFVGFVIITGLVLNRIIKLAIPSWEPFLAMGARLFGFIEERLAGAEDIRANGGVDYTMLRLHQTLRQQYVVEQKGFALGMLTFSSTQGLFRLGTALGLGLGGWLYFNGTVTIGTVFLVITYSAMLQEPLRRLTQQLQDLQRAVAGVSRIQQMFLTRPAIQNDRQSMVRLPDGPLAVEFRHVDFHYTPDKPVLHNMTFVLEPGEVLGLLGRTGSGKTTTTRLLFRLYEPQQGMVRLGNRPVQAVPLAHLRQKVGMVTQEVQLFHATIRDNLTFFNRDISDRQILAALADLELMTWFESLPNGLDTELEAGGRGLSAGEAQLLAFTRVFLQNPGVIIMDEASSRLDPATEFLIERAVDKLLRNRTAIIVAHRLQTVQRANTILILENGRIKELGDRIELVNNPNSHFSQLLQTGLEEVLV
ncbi:MAG: ABC transporter ATP-binding protein [Anaerolineales bacterium]|nr:ABC transporter ATP-binding protein [Anaerolineales bacterium]